MARCVCVCVCVCLCDRVNDFSVKKQQTEAIDGSFESPLALVGPSRQSEFFDQYFDQGGSIKRGQFPYIRQYVYLYNMSVSLECSSQAIGKLAYRSFQ